MKSVGEIQPEFRQSERALNCRGVAHRDVRRPAEGLKSADSLRARETVEAAKNPLAFQNDGEGNENVAAPDDIARASRLRVVIPYEVAHDDTSSTILRFESYQAA